MPGCKQIVFHFFFSFFFSVVSIDRCHRDSEACKKKQANMHSVVREKHAP